MPVTASGVSATAAVLALTLTSYYNWSTYHQNWIRDRLSASARVCENFAFGEGKKASDEVTALTVYLVDGQPHNKPFTTDKNRSNGDPEKVRTALYDYANMLSVTATGLDQGVYDVKVIQSCAGDLFTGLSPELSDDGKHILPLKGFERVKCWAEQFANPNDPAKKCSLPT